MGELENGEEEKDNNKEFSDSISDSEGDIDQEFDAYLEVSDWLNKIIK